MPVRTRCVMAASPLGQSERCLTCVAHQAATWMTLPSEDGYERASEGVWPYFMDYLRRLAPVVGPWLVVGATLGSSAGAATRVPSPRLPVAYETSAPGQPLAPAALDRWWLLFQDPVLNALEDEASVTAPDALAAEARIVEARAT